MSITSNTLFIFLSVTARPPTLIVVVGSEGEPLPPPLSTPTAGGKEGVRGDIIDEEGVLGGYAALVGPPTLTIVTSRGGAVQRYLRLLCR
ncbi:hypothetical protein B296_00017326 [Ensete ventricosum]|uniref:Secreted protein n=1 Tax=Ensete ventricosum TaxID=4639 RepID=A0A426ZBV4_ENSVE|nr:hypothetical protein B296_00017326 [Ensete ventricosum]